MSPVSLHLASASPRRSDILKSLGLTFTCGGVAVNEDRLRGEAADAMVLRLARAKAGAVPRKRSQLVLGADTAVVLGNDVFGKPRDRDDALEMLARLSGRTHSVLTGIALCAAQDLRSALSVTEVRFREIRPDEALAYWQSGEPCDKAGAYAIQGRGGVFVESIAGSYSGVVGLPVFETVQLLHDAGLRVLND
ncbi:MAG: Maf family nucleotide pyrophosphatase [Gammaproteobacteria bacterium]|nr:Maf family nucleotide pyrophosphatase [Gammaproteobacteria bacterium]